MIAIVGDSSDCISGETVIQLFKKHFLRSCVDLKKMMGGFRESPTSLFSIRLTLTLKLYSPLLAFILFCFFPSLVDWGISK